jgi:hypothetical protein
MEDVAAKIVQAFLSSEEGAKWVAELAQPKELEETGKRLASLYREVEKGLGDPGLNVHFGRG